MLNLQSSIAQLLNWAYQQLDGGESPKLDARVLLSHCLQKNTTYLLTWPEKIPSPEQVNQFQQLVLQRQTGRPVAYLIGYRDFWTLQLEVSENTLIPRPETELMIELALQLPLPEQAKVLDLGTGTGAIALSLAKENPAWSVTAVDVVDEAVDLAKRNAKSNGIADVEFFQSDWFTQLGSTKFDLIVSNPPYVEANSEYLDEGDVRFEPKSALTSGVDGMDDIKHIVATAPTYLNKGGWLMIEHGFQQSELVAETFRHHHFSDILHHQDLNGALRITQAKSSK
ncbi:peptide chain release factor N(5)-glutamine methyltransferase [Aliiglaciecola litoralis]|uniref:Release factor glutamine methyltransferase n=1 Tax=Aliiglaciecola litoralis TaxID=582857 RepID=A0ABP3X1Q8_9ALTE